MVVQERRKESKFTGMAMIALTSAIALSGWIGDNWYKSIDNKFQLINEKQDKIFKRIDDIVSKQSSDMICLNHNIDKCCKEAIYCG